MTTEEMNQAIVNELKATTAAMTAAWQGMKDSTDKLLAFHQAQTRFRAMSDSGLSHLVSLLNSPSDPGLNLDEKGLLIAELQTRQAKNLAEIVRNTVK